MTFSKLGTDIDTGQVVYLPKASRTKGVYILGLQGAGKSGLIENLCVEDGKQGTGFCVIDPHGELIDNVISRLPAHREHDVILFDIRDYQYPFGLNLFTCSDPTNPLVVQEVVDQVMHVFEMLVDVNPTTPQILDYLRNCTNVLVANPGYTMADVTLLLRNRTCREKLLQHVTDSSVLSFWHDYFDQLPLKEQLAESISLERRVRHFLQALTLNIVGQSKTSIDFRYVMDEGKILLVKLDSLRLPSVTKLIGALIIALFLNAAPSRTKKNLFNIYADEFPLYATEDFVTLIEQARKRQIGLAMAHQNRGQLDARTSNVASKLRDRTLGTKQKIIFTITGQDADEVAGEFDVSPQAAWEEEIAKEWVEVLKPEWYERVEEEVIDGTEPILTPVSKPLEWLLSGKTHQNKIVNDFMNKWFWNNPRIPAQREPGGVYDLFVKDMDTVLYQVMVTRNPYTVPPFSNNFYPWFNSYQSYPYLDLSSGKGVQQWQAIWTVPWAQFSQALYWLEMEARTALRETILSTVSSVEHDYEYRINTYSTWAGSIHQGWFEADFKQKLPWLVDTSGAYWSSSYRIQHLNAAKPVKCRIIFTEAELQGEINRIIAEAKPLFESFVFDLRQVMEVLAIEQNQITEKSGVEQPRKRKQINYHTHPAQTLTHPRKTIMHPQRPYQDVKNDIANQLSGLPLYTARVKLDETFPQNPGKKCLNCKSLNNLGAKFCSKCGTKLSVPNEYTIETIRPSGYIGTQQLQQRMQGIQARNRQKLYCRSKKDVEAEITKRQQSCSGGSAPARLPQQPSPQPHHARQVPVQGNCPKCGKSNPTGSKFCNQCGSPI